MRSRKVTAGVALAAVGTIAVLAAVAAMGAGAKTSAAPVGSGKASATKAVCGMGTGKKATGAPIKIGALNMLIPGVDFTTVAKLAAAYFQCVNDNGGINGRPIQYIQYTEDLNPSHEAALARKLVESDKVVGIVGNTSFGECGTNWKYYQSKGFIVLGAGVQAECYSTPSYAEDNMGPRYSNMNAAQYLIAKGAKTIVIASPSTLSAYADGFLPKMAKEAGISYKIYPTVLPVTDANSQLTSMVQAAGDHGAIILDFTPDTAPAFLQAAISQGVVDKVMWGSSTPIANTAMAQQFGAFDNKIFINQEMANLDSTGPDETLYQQINAKYTPKIAIQAFGQFGYLDAKMATAALLSIKGAITAKSYNAAVKGLVNQKTDMLCKPFYVGNIPYHIPNNADITVTYNAGKVTQVQGCKALPTNVDPQIATTLAWEKKYKLVG
jgi:branched-chain amino acid transport system substrate-binding protein